MGQSAGPQFFSLWPRMSPISARYWTHRSRSFDRSDRAPRGLIDQSCPALAGHLADKSRGTAA